jgi:hypothetical protein
MRQNSLSSSSRDGGAPSSGNESLIQALSQGEISFAYCSPSYGAAGATRTATQVSLRLPRA